MAEELGSIKWSIDVDTADLGRAEVAMDKTGEAADRNKKKVVDAGKEVTKTYDTAAASVKRFVAAYLGLNAAMATARGVVAAADGWKQVNNQLRQVTASEMQLRAVRAQLLGVSKDTNSELRTTVGLYSEMLRATRDLGTSQKTVASVTNTINNLFKAGGKSAAETAGAVRQLTQGLASGALRGDEFNSVAEGAPRILDALAKHLKMARGELRDFAATGGITAEILIDALSGYSAEAQRMADLTEETFGQKMVNAKTNVMEFAGESNTLSGSVNLLGDGIEGLSEHLDTAAALATVVAAVMAGRFVTSMAAATTQMIATSGAAVTLNSSLALLGGPVGLALIAAGGIAALTLREKELADQSWETARSFEGVLAAIGEMTKQDLVDEAMRHQQATEALRAKIAMYKRLGSMDHEIKPFVDELAREEDILGFLTRRIAEFNNGTRGMSAEQKAAADYVQMMQTGLTELNDTTLTTAEYVAMMGIKTEEQREAEEKLNEEREKANRTIAEQIAGMRTEIVLIQMSNKQRAIAEALLKATNTAREAGRALTGEETRQIVQNTAALFDQQEAIDNAAQARKDAAEEAKRLASEMATMQKRALENIQQDQRQAAQNAADDWRTFRDSFADNVVDMKSQNKDLVDTIEDAWDGLGVRIMADLAASGFLSLLTGKGGGISVAETLAGAGTSGKLLAGLAAKFLPGFTGVGATITDAEFQQAIGGKSASPGQLNMTDLTNIAKSIGAGIAGGAIGKEVGESIFGKTAESSWGATAGGAAGAWFGGPMGSFIGSAIGSMIDAAFGGDGKQRSNAGFLASPTPGLKQEYNAGEHTFASGLKVTLFERRAPAGSADQILEVFDQVDRSYVDLIEELGGKVHVTAMRGLDEEANPGSYGNFFGQGGNGTTQGDIAAQVVSYISQLADNTTGLDAALLDAVRSAASAEEALTLLTKAVVDKNAADKEAKKVEQEVAETAAKNLNERIRLQDEYDELSMTATQLLQKQRDALEEANRPLFDNIQLLKESKAAEEKRKAAFESVLDATKRFMSDLRSEQEDEIRDRYSVIMDAERDLHGRRLSLVKSLSETIASLRLGNLSTMSPRDQLAFAQSQFRGFATTAFDPTKSMQERVTAAESLRTSAEQYLNAGQRVNASSAPQKAIFAEVMQTLEAAKFLGTNKPFDPVVIQNEQLAELKKLNAQVGVLPPGIAGALSGLMSNLIVQARVAGLSPVQTANEIRNQGPDAVAAANDHFQQTYGTTVEQAATDPSEILAYVDYLKSIAPNERWLVEKAVEKAKEMHLNANYLGTILTGSSGASVEQILARHNIPMFAEGGDHEGGWRVVGEEGPELEYTGRSKIFNNRDSQAMLAGSDDKQDKIVRLLEHIGRVLMTSAQMSATQRSKTNQLLAEVAGEAKAGRGTGSRKFKKAA